MGIEAGSSSGPTALRRNQLEIERQLGEIEIIYGTAPVGLCVFDAAGHYVRVNRRMAEMHGVSAARHLGRTPREVVPDLADQIELVMRRVLETGSAVTGVVVSGTTAARPGAVRTWGQHWSPLKDVGGRVIEINVVAEEITERKRAEEALRKSRDELERRVAERIRDLSDLVAQLRREMDRRAKAEHELRASDERYRLIAEKVDDVIWTASRSPAVASQPGETARKPASFLGEFRVSYVNPAVERLTGHAVQEVIGMPLEDLLPAASHSFVSQLYEERRARTADEPETIEMELVAKDGSRRWCEVTNNVVRDAGGEIIAVVGIARDISERKTLEQELSHISTSEQERVGQDLHDGLAQELVGMGLVAKGIERSLAKKGLPEAESMTRLVDMLRSAQGHVYALIKGLRPVEVDAEGLMAALAELAASTETLAGVSCRFDCPRSVAVKDDNTADHLFRIAQEAVRNAVKHAEASEITIGLVKDGGLSLRVEDDGAGIPPEGQRRAGMGLRIMRHRAGLLGGVLDVRRASPRGTILTCTLGESPR
jgi:PAS domain S-box-containing protein